MTDAPDGQAGQAGGYKLPPLPAGALPWVKSAEAVAAARALELVNQALAALPAESLLADDLHLAHATLHTWFGKMDAAELDLRACLQIREKHGLDGLEPLRRLAAVLAKAGQGQEAERIGAALGERARKALAELAAAGN